MSRSKGKKGKTTFESSIQTRAQKKGGQQVAEDIPPQSTFPGDEDETILLESLKVETSLPLEDETTLQFAHQLEPIVTSTPQVKLEMTEALEQRLVDLEAQLVAALANVTKLEASAQSHDEQMRELQEQLAKKEPSPTPVETAPTTTIGMVRCIRIQIIFP